MLLRFLCSVKAELEKQCITSTLHYYFEILQCGKNLVANAGGEDMAEEYPWFQNS